jgi:FtsH-binding integral membrane protein
MISTRSAEYATERPLLGNVETIGAAGVLGQAMALVAFTLAFTALGGYLGAHLAPGPALGCLLAGFACVVASGPVARRTERLATCALLAGGLLVGLGLGPTLHEQLRVDPDAVWQAAGATALLVSGFGAAGYTIRRDLSPAYRGLFAALLALLAGGLFAVLTSIPAAELGYSLAGVVIFAGYVLVDFNLMRRARVQDSVPLAAGIFLDIINIFLFLLDLLGRTVG